jgi:hypothetical protein
MGTRSRHGAALVATLLLHAATARAKLPSAQVELVRALRVIGEKANAKPSRPADLDRPAAGPACRALTKAERATLRRRVLAWIDREHPDEHAPIWDGDSGELDLSIGCQESSGFVPVALGQDRDSKTQKTRRNYLLRVSTDAIERVAVTTSAPRHLWMEDADEGRLELLAQIDLDGDGVPDLVWSDTEHEGGAPSYANVAVRYGNGRKADIATIKNLVGVQIQNGALVMAAESREDNRQHYGCVGKDLRVTVCPAARQLQRAEDRRDVAARYADMRLEDLPDRELLAEELAMLGIKDTTLLLSAAAATTPVLHAQRNVTRFLFQSGAQDDLDGLVDQPHPEVRAFLDSLARSFGDQPCTAQPLSEQDRAKINEWIKRQDARPIQVAMAAAACGPYAWAAWSRDGDSRRREALLGREGMTRILGFSYAWDETSEGLQHTEAFFRHDAALIAIAIHDQDLWIVANGKVVTQSKGRVALYQPKPRRRETSSDIVVDNGTLWHATPAGRDKLDPKLVREYQAPQAALARVLESAPSSDRDYLAALRTLGADAALIAECAALTR